jgi:hypothetical protein
MSNDSGSRLHARVEDAPAFPAELVVPRLRTIEDSSAVGDVSRTKPYCIAETGSSLLGRSVSLGRCTR